MKVYIQTAGHVIEVESAEGNLQELADLAHKLWQDTRDPKLDRAAGATGFTAERSSGPEYVAAHQIDLRSTRP